MYLESADKEDAVEMTLRSFDLETVRHNALLLDQSRVRDGGRLSSVSQQDHTATDGTSRLAQRYGPCTGLSRLQRWERAEKLGLQPPKNIRELLSELPADDPKAANLWAGRV